MINKCLGYSGIQGTWNHFWWGNQTRMQLGIKTSNFIDSRLWKEEKSMRGGGGWWTAQFTWKDKVAYRTRSLKHKEWNEMKWKTIGKERKTEQKGSTCHLRQINCSFGNVEKSCLRSIFKTLTFHVLILLAAWMSFVSHLVHGY